MATTNLAILHCTFETTQCTSGGHRYCVVVDQPVIDGQVQIVDNVVTCGHCYDVVYPYTDTLERLLVRCEGGVVVFWHNGSQTPPGAVPILMHRCEHDMFEVTDQALQELIVSTPVTAGTS